MTGRAIQAIGVATLLTLATLSCADEIDFQQDVRPILARCLVCHGPDEGSRVADLRLDTADGSQTPRGSRPAVVLPGRADESVLLQRVMSDDPRQRMPPPSSGEPLAKDEIDILRRWIDAGATYDIHWAFVPPRMVDPPPADGWSSHPIDGFVHDRLEVANLTPSPEADRATLLRRVSLGLTGLPPTPEAVDAFLADTTPGAYERLVDGLLASPHFGERWASVWLDLARYADTKGYEADRRRTIWPYRDWVIDAYNADVPFDQFTIDQLAGDLQPDATHEQLIATAFHRNTMTNDEGGTDDEEFRTAAVLDRVDTTMQVWNGLTAGCAQCHTHKYDPLSHREYYALVAFFNQTADADRMDETPLLDCPTSEQTAAIERLVSRIEAQTSLLESLTRGVDSRRPAWERSLATARTPGDGLVRRVDLNERDVAELNDPQAEEPVVTGGVIGDAGLFARGRSLDVGDLGDVERDQAFTAAAWIRPDTNDTMVPFARMATAPYRGWDLYMHEGRWYVHMIHEWPGSTLRVNTKQRLIERGVWQHVAITYDGASRGAGLHIAVNGVPAEMETTHDTLDGTIRTERPFLVGRRYGQHHFEGGVDELRFYDRALTAAELTDLVRADLGTLATEHRLDHHDAILSAVHRSDQPDLARARTTLGDLERELGVARGAIPRMPILRELPAEMHRVTHVLSGGNFLSPLEAVDPDVPAILGSLPTETAGDRDAFARWLVSDDQPLTARVQVNRVWEQLFGTGLVETSEDFGTQGAFPSHPALLDWLAVRHRRDGWSFKQLCRLIVTSATYRQSGRYRADAAEIDARNYLMWRGPRFRLSAEMVRDQALAASGLLNPALHGPPVFPPQPDSVWEMVYSNDRWTENTDADRYRRALYTFWRRTSPYPSMMTFDAPSREYCVARRLRTNTPLQALVTLNDLVFLESARALARRGLTETAGDDRSCAERMLRLALGRKAEGREIDELVALVARQRMRYATAVEDARRLSGAREGEDAIALAAWTIAGNVILNLDEFLVNG